MARFACLECARTYPLDEVRYRCTCGGLLEVHGEWSWDASRATGRGVWRYRSLLPVAGDVAPVTLREGDTPLLECPRLAEWAGVRELRVKVEGANPTGSFKDRGMTLGVTLARSLGMKSVGCASTGNTSASLAAYAARAGMRALVLLPAGKIAAGKLAQAVAHGARVVEVEGSFDDAMALAETLSLQGEVYLLNSLNPLRLEGQKTLLFEVLEACEPDRVVFPVGNGGNVSAAHKAMGDAREAGLSRHAPILTGVQAEGAAPLARAFAGAAYAPVAKPETVATAIRIGDPVNAKKALRAVRETGGVLTSVTDEVILDAQRRMAREEGIFVEPASAAPLAGLKRLVDEGRVARTESVVLVATGNGLKDPDVVSRSAPAPTRIPATLERLMETLR